MRHKYFDGNPNSPQDKLFTGAVEWCCECGCKNIILPRVAKVIDRSLHDEKLHIHLEYMESPQYGLCEDCFAEYNLCYPMPESLEKHLRNQGYEPMDDK